LFAFAHSITPPTLSDWQLFDILMDLLASGAAESSIVFPYKNYFGLHIVSGKNQTDGRDDNPFDHQPPSTNWAGFLYLTNDVIALLLSVMA
jgi:hypothetical protein